MPSKLKTELNDANKAWRQKIDKEANLWLQMWVNKLKKDKDKIIARVKKLTAAKGETHLTINLFPCNWLSSLYYPFPYSMPEHSLLHHRYDNLDNPSDYVDNAYRLAELNLLSEISRIFSRAIHGHTHTVRSRGKMISYPYELLLSW